MNRTKTSQDTGMARASDICRKTIFWWLPLLYLLISSAFYLRTYDSAQVKITLLQMGGLCLLALWLCRLAEEGWQVSFSKENLSCLAPFLAFLASGIVSFICAPYHWSSLDFFLRRIFYMTIALIVIREFNEEAVARLIRFLIWSTWIACGYGLLQWVDYHFFPQGIGQGIDPFLWRGAFGDRLFSTYGNPNFFADYLVLMFPILACQFFKTRRSSLLVLIALDLFNIYGSQTKGAWIGLAISIVFLTGTYLYYFHWELLVRYSLRIAAIMFTMVMLTLSGVALKLRQSFTSINFRVFTWEATWEMIMTKPILGTGIGSFWVIYPAFRRPPIFHIEGRHNTETDHVEDEYLEVLFDEGIVGFGIFIWLILSTFLFAYRALGQMVGGLKSGERAPPRAFDLVGFLVALQGMLAHNFFDVSMRFVSSGVYLGLLSGMTVNLSRGAALSDLTTRQDDKAAPLQSIGTVPSAIWWGEPLLWVLRLATAVGGCALLVIMVLRFSQIQPAGDQIRSNGEFLQWAVSWICLLYCSGRLAYSFLRVLWSSRNVFVQVIIAAMIPPLYFFWGFFRADVYQNMAIAYSKAAQWDQALKSYSWVGKFSPSYIMSFYFSGNVFSQRFNMIKVYNPDWGDTGGVARDDFERALASYDQVRARSPNYVQTLHQLGNLYFRHGDWLMRQGRVAEGQKDWDTALEYFQRYHNIDPVFPQNYFAAAQIHVLRRQYDKAIEVYRSLIDAKECRIAPSLLSKDWMRDTFLSYQSYVIKDGQWVHLHESPQAYSDMGGAYWMKGDLENAERSFREALRLDPNFAPAAQNLERLRDIMRHPAVSRQPSPMTPIAPSGVPAVPSFELIPSRR